MPCNEPCKTIGIQSTGSHVQYQEQDQAGNWVNRPVPGASSNISEVTTNLHIRTFVRFRQDEAQRDANVQQRPFPPYPACPHNCPCVGTRTTGSIAPTYTEWKEFTSTVGRFRIRFKVDREIVFVEGLCIEIPEVWDFVESQYATTLDAPGQTAEVVLVLERLTATLARIETVLGSLDYRLSNLERPS